MKRMKSKGHVKQNALCGCTVGSPRARVKFTSPFLEPFPLFFSFWAWFSQLDFFTIPTSCLTSLDVCWSSEIIKVIHVDYINNWTYYYCSILKDWIRKKKKYTVKQLLKSERIYMHTQSKGMRAPTSVESRLGSPRLIHGWDLIWGKIPYSQNASLYQGA